MKLDFRFLRSALFGCGLAAALHSGAQSLPPLTPVVPPSPTAQAMQKYGDIPVSAYTGVPNISIPLYTIKYHDISVPINISYHASGIKVAEEASNVGLGWILNAGGAISRNMIGYDDFFVNTPTTYLGQFKDIADGKKPVLPIQGNAILKLLSGGTETSDDISAGIGVPTIEYQPDQFYYNVMGKTGKFILRRNGTPILQSLEKVDITCSTDGKTWDMKTVDGFDYQFAQPELSRSTLETQLHVSAVYLTKIISPTGNVVTFSYNVNTNFEQAVGPYTQSWDQLQFGPGYQPVAFPSAGVPATPQICYTVYLSKIDYGTGQVQFNYTQDREDIQYDNKLNSITVYNKDAQGNLASTPVKTLAFTYKYANGTANANPNAPGGPTQRMELTSVTESGAYNGQSASANPYTFTYNDADAGILPAKTSLGRDHWGYYNGKSNTTLIPTYDYSLTNSTNTYIKAWGIPNNIRDADPLYAQAFMLTDITYPTGGTTHFDFESNDCDEQWSSINDFSGAPFMHTIIPQVYGIGGNNGYSWYLTDTSNPPNLDLTNGYTNANNVGIPGTMKVSFVLAGETSQTVDLVPGMSTLTFYDKNNNNVYSFDPVTQGESFTGAAIVFNLTALPAGFVPGVYTIVAKSNSPGYLKQDGSGYVQVAHIDIQCNWYTEVNDQPSPNATNPITYSVAGGVRIKRITDNDGINPPVIKKFIYHYNVGQTPEYSYGRRMSRPEYSYFELAKDVHQVQVDDKVIDYSSTSEHLFRISDSNIPLNGSALGAVVGYDQVTEYYGEHGENGMTVYQYHNNPDTVPQFYLNGLPAKRPYNSNLADPLNGSLLKQTDYKNVNGQFVPVKETTNTYFQDFSQENYVYAVEDHIPLHGFWSTDGTPSTPNYTALDNTDRYINVYSTLQSAWTYLNKTDVKDYTSTDPTQYSETVTNYYYDNPVHYLPTRTITTNSKQELLTTTTAYPNDVTNQTGTDDVSLGVQNLVANHLLNAPVEKYLKISNADGTNARTTSAQLVAFEPSGISVPKTVYGLQTVIPLTGFASYAASGTKNTAYQPQLYLDAYDATTGNLQQQHKYKDVNYAYQWGYDKAYPIAQCKNAAQNQFYFQGFEESTGANISSATAHTGHNSYSAASYVLNWTIPDGLTYVISYWYLSGGAWTYSGEHPFTGNTATLTGGTAYDDIRIYPSEAQLTTYTYDIGVGMTSSTDPKGETTYYEYDGLLRLLNIKDAGGNIVKSFSYNYATPPTSGTVTYYSAAQAGMFQKAGCTGSASLGTNVIYTVNPGTYTSTSGQADADGQAVGDVAINGQAYANTNGGCVVPLFYSDEISALFTPACSAGNSAPQVMVSVPYGQYTSATSKAAANLLAQTYAQNQANSTGVCSASSCTFTVTNSTGQANFVISFSSPNNTGYSNINSSGTTILTVPQGVYQVSIAALSTSNNWKFTLGARPAQSTTGAFFNNVQIKTVASGELSLTIQNP